MLNGQRLSVVTPFAPGHKELLRQPCFSLYRVLPGQCSPLRPAPASTANPPGCGCVPTRLPIWFSSPPNPPSCLLPPQAPPATSREDSPASALWGHCTGSTPHPHLCTLHPPLALLALPGLPSITSSGSFPSRPLFAAGGCACVFPGAKEPCTQAAAAPRPGANFQFLVTNSLPPLTATL